MPVGEKEGTLLLVVMLSFVAGRAKGNCADEGTSAEEIKDLPDEFVGVKLVTREDLALGVDSSRSLLGTFGISKVEEIDVTEIEVREVGEHGIGQPRGIIDKRIPRRCSRWLRPRRGNIVLVGRYPMFQISNGS